MICPVRRLEELYLALKELSNDPIRRAGYEFDSNRRSIPRIDGSVHAGKASAARLLTGENQVVTADDLNTSHGSASYGLARSGHGCFATTSQRMPRRFPL
ncbi:hypothetical protein GCM10010458_16270 [Microbacterium luteolum]